MVLVPPGLQVHEVLEYESDTYIHTRVWTHITQQYFMRYITFFIVWSGGLPFVNLLKLGKNIKGLSIPIPKTL